MTLHLTMRTEDVQNHILALPDLAAWPEVGQLVAQESEIAHIDWRLPLISCHVLGENVTPVVPAVAAMACLQMSIIVVDDLLDEDEEGIFHQMGIGRTANLALALQASILALIDQCAVSAERRWAASMTLNQAAVSTAMGQELDVQNLSGEANYWRVVQAKSTPYFAAGLQVGAQLAGADPATVRDFNEIGVLFGEIVQIGDDLIDAFKVPANPDWTQGRNNLAVLYAATAEYAESQRFCDLRAMINQGHVDSANLLHEAQQLLIRSGAVSYCIYQAMQREQLAHELLYQLDLQDTAPLTEIFVRQRKPLVTFLETIGVAVPDDFFGVEYSFK